MVYIDVKKSGRDWTTIRSNVPKEGEKGKSLGRSESFDVRKTRELETPTHNEGPQ